MRKKDFQAIGAVLMGIIAIIGYAIQNVLDALGQYGLFYILIGIVALVFLGLWYDAHRKEQRRQALLVKYGDIEIVTAIMSGNIWVGQTVEQLQDAMGAPVDVDEHVLKTKRKEIWKYQRRGRNRYALRVTLDNGLVVGWKTSH